METGNAMELKDYVIQSLNVWKGGGWTMIPLLIVAMGIYVSAMSLVVWFRRREYRNVTEKEWRSWVLLWSFQSPL